MAARKSGKKLRAGGQAAEGKLRMVGKKSIEGVGNGRDNRASIRQTRAIAKEAADAIDGASSSPEVKQTRENAKPESVRKFVSVRKVTKDSEDGTEKCGRLEKSQARACTRYGRWRGLTTTESSRNEDLEVTDYCLPSVTAWDWTERQEKCLLESLSTIKPGVNFWRLIAERVPGRSAEDCFKKFYSGRKTTRAATRCRTEELNSCSSVKNGTNCVGSLRTKTPMDVKKTARETRAVGRATTGPAKQESKISGKGHDGAFTRQTRATSQGAKRRRIDAACNSPDINQKKARKPESIQEAKNVKLKQRGREGSKRRTGKQNLVEKLQVRASTPGVAVASGIDRSSLSDVGDKEIGGPSALGISDDNNVLWTKVQEAALQDAYSTIRPSANFWHLISKRVPGRSAEECFNKFYAGHPTPPRIAQRSCLRVVDCPPTLPNPPKAKATRGKQLLEAHRAVRNILRRQQVDDKNYDADAFAALEPPDVVHGVMVKAKEEESPTLDDREMEFSVYVPLPGSTENSATLIAPPDKENQKPKAVGESRDFGICQWQPFSPEILKKVGDPLMLDKYIDHLHQRRSRRSGTKSTHKNAQKASGLNNLSKDGLDFREVRLAAIHRAKQELRDVFLRPGSAVDEPFLDLVDDITDGEDDDPVDSSM